MNKTTRVHFGGQKEVCGVELAEKETVETLMQRLCKEGHLGEFRPEELCVCIEDSDEELARDCRLEQDKHKHIHVCRCRKADVSIDFNGVTKSHPYTPGTTLRKVIERARREFGVDMQAKLVLRLESPKSEPLDPDSHVGSYVHHPGCKVTFYLTPKVRIEG